MAKNLIYIVNGLIASGYIGYLLLVLFSRRDKLKKVDGFNATKDILKEYDKINIIENKGILTYYNIKRKVIKIASKSYSGNSVSDLAIPLIEAGVSATDNQDNKNINIFRYIIPNLKILYILPIIIVIINNVTYSIGDAKIGIVISLLFSIISFMIINIKCDSRDFIFYNLKDNRTKILNFINKVILLDKFIFVGEIVMVMRCVMILFIK